VSSIAAGYFPVSLTPRIAIFLLVLTSVVQGAADTHNTRPVVNTSWIVEVGLRLESNFQNMSGAEVDFFTKSQSRNGAGVISSNMKLI